MGRESDYKMKNTTDFPTKINKAIEKWDAQHLIKLRKRVTGKIRYLISIGSLEASNGWNNMAQFIDNAMDVVVAKK
ncbi:MAG: hypothetical protein ACD_2C00102G0004 [uncultured bacterium (gcode 4)]|uniref:Uncharacterized protein n=1 Tax=uncultured bacterium (gcode 4) TaxID=1234023 RepID=K2G3H3_9BACT|nr:MAG: hypothetical protein ACD_2C00102G0004 [uncultured bacterium (gcode 4)]